MDGNSVLWCMAMHRFINCQRIEMKGLICCLFCFHLISIAWTQVCQGEFGFEKLSNIVVDVQTKILLVGSDNQPVSKDCLSLCLQSTDCYGFSLNYTSHECAAVSVRDGKKITKSSYIPSTNNNFYRKLCNIAVDNPKCNDKPWAIERVFSSFMDETTDDDTHEAHSVDDCINSCLSSSSCRSATYDEDALTCILHRQNRRTRPTAFHTKPNETREYLENQCADLKSSNCHYVTFKNASVVTKDAISTALTQLECEHKCDQEERDLCRSYSYDSTQHLCYLSGDDTISLGRNATQREESIYGERKCVPENCTNGPSAYERVTGLILQTVTTPNGPQPVDLTKDLTKTCLKECQDKGSKCIGVIMDYTNFLCQYVTERNIGSTYSDFSIAIGASYFERVCLNEIPSQCQQKEWIFDRVPGSYLEGFDDKILHGILSRSQCEDACLKERTFFCRSAEYYSSIVECRLSKEDRRTRPDAFVAKDDGVDYLENQCLFLKSDCKSERKPDAFPTYIDAVRSNTSSEEACAAECANINSFTCRAYGYRSISSECLLSSVDKTAGGPDSILPRPETVYVSRVCRVMAENIQELITQRPVITQPPQIPWITKPPQIPWITKPPIIPPWSSHAGRCDKGGAQIYEKSPGFALGIEDISSSTFTASVPGITAECRGRCDLDPTCSGFTLDYVKLSCQFHSIDVLNDAARERLIPSPSSAYFEVACVKVARGCNRLWTFDRYLDKVFLAFPAETLTGVPKAACEEACLAEKRFVCRSLTYSRFRGECRLFKDDRFMLPQAFTDSAGTDYLENQCAGVPFFITPRQGKECDNARHLGKFLQFAEENKIAQNERECAHLCNFNNNFTCRAYSFFADTKQCLLSSTTALDIHVKLADSLNAVYVERTCEAQLQLEDISTTTPINTCTAAGFSMERTIGVVPNIKHKQILKSATLIGTSKNCIRSCNHEKTSCMAFVQKLGMSCLSFPNTVARESLIPSIGTIYFEKICLRAIGCGKLWIFDRLIGYELAPNLARRVHKGVVLRQECQELCLQEVAFVCRSVVFAYDSNECRLYNITRYTSPSVFRRLEISQVDYMENQCAPRS